jgi:hypothetical protein
MRSLSENRGAVSSFRFTPFSAFKKFSREQEAGVIGNALSDVSGSGWKSVRISPGIVYTGRFEYTLRPFPVPA